MVNIELNDFSGKGSAKAKLAYAQKLKLLALAKQVSVGPYQPERASEVGLLDVVGNDRLYFLFISFFIYIYIYIYICFKFSFE